MLDFLRRSASSIVVKALLLLLIVSFGAWGIGDIFRGRSNVDVVATVGESDITTPYFRAELAREIDRMSQMFGTQLSREQATLMGVDRMLLDRLVNTQLIQEGAREMGMSVADATIAKGIKTNTDFFNEAGQFDRRVYSELLSRAGLNEDMYVARVRQAIAREQYLSPIAEGTVAPQPLLDALYKRLSETRVLDVVRISHVKVKGVSEPSDEQLAAFYEDNAQRFMAPEYRQLTAIVLSAVDVAKTIEVSDAELQDAYDAHADQYITPEARVLRQILVKDEAAAQQAAALLGGGKAVAEVAAQVGANAAMVELGTFTRADADALSPEIGEAAFTAPKGGHTPPLKSPLGWHVLVVDDVIAGTRKTLNDVRDDLIATVRGEVALDLLFEQSNQLEDLLGGGQTLEEAAREMGVEPVRIPAVAADGTTPQGQPTPVAYATDVIAKGFELSEGADSMLSETEDGQAFFIVRVDAVTPPAVRPLDTVREQATALWLQDQRAKKAAEIADAAKARLATGEDAATVAQDLGVDAFTTEPFNRLGEGLEQGALPATLIEQVFALPVGGVDVALGTDAHTVARLTTVTATDVDRDSRLYTALRERTTGALQGDLLSQLATALQERHPVSINQGALNALNADN